MRTLFNLIIVMLLAVANVAHADQCLQEDAGAAVFHVNGVATDEADAFANLEELRLALGKQLGGLRVRYDLSYNYTHHVILDLLQAATQLGLQFTSKVMQWMSGAPEIPDWLANILKRALQGAYPLVASELNDHVDKYRDALWQGRRVLLVAHSQGNLYANQAYEVLRHRHPELLQGGSVGMYGVATPASNVLGASAPYLTNNRDFISLTPGALADNITMRHAADGTPVPALDAGGPTLIRAHSFVDSYLSPAYNLRPKMLQDMRSLMGGLARPAASSGDGPVSVTLSWGSNHDLELVVYEPDGRFVNAQFSNGPGSPAMEPPRGRAGYIFPDARHGGQERYLTSCNQLAQGEYLLGAQYIADMSNAIYASSSAECADALANSSSPYPALNKDFCVPGATGPTPAMNVPASLRVVTPDGAHDIPFVIALGPVPYPATLNDAYVRAAEIFASGARLIVREVSGSANPNDNGRLAFSVLPAPGQLPIPPTWRHVLDSLEGFASGG